MKRPRLKLSLEQKDSLRGYAFTLPLVIGFVFFFLYPFAQSIMFSVSRLLIGSTGFELEYVGLRNYRQALLVDPQYLRVLVETIGAVLGKVPLILAFSFIAALLLNQRFKGRMLARVVFFLPVIYGAGIILKMESTDYVTMLHSQGQASPTEVVRMGSALRSFLMDLCLPESLLNYIMSAIDQVPVIVRSSGIQILVFLAGLQSISPNLYQAAEVEGATRWETFWIITLPMISPLILTNLVYTIVDSFTSGSNRLISMIRDTAFGTAAGYGVSSAMSWMYFVVIGLVLLVSVSLISRKVFYQD